MIVTTQYGKIQGLNSGGVNVFLGIPYALPPIENLRFRRAMKCKKHEGILPTLAFKSKAPQPNIGLIRAENDLSESEDCLYLNVWASSLPKKKKPVVVWIHGGAFAFGEAAAKLYDGTSFAKNGSLVFVSIQYRLGILGFSDFSFLDPNTSTFETNVGLSDQIMALKWIRQNISVFGGDPKNITVMGESAGASSILCLMTSPAAKGLFQKAICQSPVVGSVQDPKTSLFWAKQALSHLGLPENQKEALKTVSFKELNAVVQKMMETFTELTPGRWPIGPTIDGDLVPCSLEEAFSKGLFSPVPLIVGTNKDEAANFIRDSNPWLPSTVEQLECMFDQNPEWDKPAILSHYTDFPSKETFRNIGRDFCFVKGTILVADTNALKAPTFVYRFDFETDVCKKLGLGAFHGLELPFVFAHLDAELKKLFLYHPQEAKSVMETVHSMWIRFIQKGDPNGDNMLLWKAYRSNTRGTLLIDQNLLWVEHPERGHDSIWVRSP